MYFSEFPIVMPFYTSWYQTGAFFEPSVLSHPVGPKISKYQNIIHKTELMETSDLQPIRSCQTTVTDTFRKRMSTDVDKNRKEILISIAV